MQCTEFVSELKKKLPDLKKLKELNYTDGEIEDIKESYVLPTKDVSINLYPEMGELGELMSKYEVSKLQVGMIEFFDKPLKENDKLIIGKVEVDKLIYSKEDSIFYVTDGDKELWKISDCPEKLLNALLNMKEYFSKVMIDEALYENYDVLESYAKKSAELAGGAQFINFYRMLLGI